MNYHYFSILKTLTNCYKQITIIKSHVERGTLLVSIGYIQAAQKAKIRFKFEKIKQCLQSEVITFVRRLHGQDW